MIRFSKRILIAIAIALAIALALSSHTLLATGNDPVADTTVVIRQTVKEMLR